MSTGASLRTFAALAAIAVTSCRVPAEGPKDPPPPPAKTAAPAAPSSAAASSAAQPRSFASLGAALPPPAPGPRGFVVRYVDLSSAPGSPLLEPGAKALRDSDHAAAKRELAAALAKLDPAVDFVPWLVAHALWGRACHATGDAACAEREYDLIRSAWSDPAAAEQRAIAGEPEPLAQMQTLGRAITATGEALFFFADKHRREKVGAIQMPEYKGNGSQRDISRHFAAAVMPWQKDKLVAIGAAEKEYSKIIHMPPLPSPRWSIEAAIAAARMWTQYIAEVMKTPVPADPKKPGYAQLVADWKQVLVVSTYPAQKRARNAYEACRMIHDKVPGHDETAKECLDWLEKNPAPETPPQPPEWAKQFVPPDVLKKLEEGTP